MIEMDLVICNQLGLHARASSQVVNTSLKYVSDITLTVVGSSIQANCKSIMSLLMLGAPYDTLVKVTVSGQDEIKAAKAIKRLIQNRFGEDG